jgi:raffinose/stachyose/melibiose transport system permease protein
MSIALAGATVRPRRRLATWVEGLPALACFLVAVYFLNETDTPKSLAALGAFLVTGTLFLVRAYPRRPYLAFIMPSLAIYTLFVMVPAIMAFRFSLYNWTGLGNPTDFVGIGNYREIFSNREFGNALWNNVQLFLAIFVAQNIIALPLALALDGKPRFHEFYRAGLFMPVIISLVASGYIWQIIFGPNIGMLGPLLDAIHLPGLKRDWLADRFLTFKLVMLVQAWQHMGGPIVIYLAGLQSIPVDLKDAARVDGASAWQVFRDVVFPLLAPAFTVVTVTTFIAMFRAFDIPYVLGGPGGTPDGTTDVLSLVIYREAFGLGGIVGSVYRQGYAVAAGVVMFAFLLLAVSIQVGFLRRREVSL